jgi:diguanylate cyclase (GGDEF)-like protein
VHSRVLGAGERSLEGERFDRHIVETYVPVMDGERFDGAFEVYYDITARRQDLDGRLRAMNMSLGLLLSILLAMFAAILTRSYTTALCGERAHSRRLHEEIEHRLRVESDLRESHGHFVHMAHHDPLTGMPNRTLFFDRFDHALANARRYETGLALLFIDLDRFKSINDTYGHEAGDALLKAAAAILLDNIRESDTAARSAGDEFAVLIEHAETVTVDNLVARLAREFASDLDLGGAKVAISASIGISLYPQDGDDIETLLHRADIAMYRAKGEMRGSWQYFDGQIQTQGAID